MIWKLSDLIQHCNACQAEIGGRYVPARPLRLLSGRVRAAWLVLTDHADAVVWPGGQ